ncbi:MAG: hypothetical protein R2818_00770 [Flavobacteriales bacterium]
MGKGREVRSHDELPGEFYSKNITPFALANWSDGEVYRAIANGVSKGWSSVLSSDTPMATTTSWHRRMYSEEWSHHCDHWINPKTKPYPASDIDFPLSVIMRTFHQPAHPMERPAMTDRATGNTLRMQRPASECHTNMVKGEKVGETLAGGFSSSSPTARSYALRTSHRAMTGSDVGRENSFIQRFKQYTDSSYVVPAVD